MSCLSRTIVTLRRMASAAVLFVMGTLVARPIAAQNPLPFTHLVDSNTTRPDGGNFQGNLSLDYDNPLGYTLPVTDGKYVAFNVGLYPNPFTTGTNFTGCSGTAENSEWSIPITGGAITKLAGYGLNLEAAQPASASTTTCLGSRIGNGTLFFYGYYQPSSTSSTLRNGVYQVPLAGGASSSAIVVGDTISGNAVKTVNNVIEATSSATVSATGTGNFGGFDPEYDELFKTTNSAYAIVVPAYPTSDCTPSNEGWEFGGILLPPVYFDGSIYATYTIATGLPPGGGGDQLLVLSSTNSSSFVDCSNIVYKGGVMSDATPQTLPGNPGTAEAGDWAVQGMDVDSGRVFISLKQGFVGPYAPENYTAIYQVVGGQLVKIVSNIDSFPGASFQTTQCSGAYASYPGTPSLGPFTVRGNWLVTSITGYTNFNCTTGANTTSSTLVAVNLTTNQIQKIVANNDVLDAGKTTVISQAFGLGGFSVHGSLASDGHFTFMAYAALNGASSANANVIWSTNLNAAPTQIGLTVAPATETYGQNVALSAMVSTTTAGGGTPTGSVQFLDGTTVLGTQALDSNGSATLTLDTLKAGVHSITAQYLGADPYQLSTSGAAQVTITQVPTSLVVSTSNPTIFTSAPVTFSAQLSGISSVGAPTGSISFLDGGTSLGTGPINSTGAASLPVASLAFGTHSITAMYAGDTNYVGSTSPAITETVTLPTTPGVTLSPASLTFPSQTDGTTSAAQTVTLTNSGTATLTISSIAASGDFAQTHTCGTSVAAGGSCTISVTFTPSAPGTRTGALTVADNATGSPQAVSLTGTGAATAPTATLSPTSLTFASANVGATSAAQTVTLTNSGNAALSLTSISASGDFAASQSCGTSIAAGGSCSISVTFTPSAPGTRTGSLTVADNATGSPQTVSLSGTGVATAPNVTLAPTALTFASQTTGTTSSAQTVTLTNSGNAALNLTSISASGDFAVSQSCGASLAAGGSCPLSVTFTPTSPGTRTGNVSVSDNATGSPQTVSLTGTGAVPVVMAPAVTLAPTSLMFTGETLGSTSAAQTVTLTNSGTAALSLTSIAASGDFAVSQSCGTSLAAGGSCPLSITFTPTSTGTRTGTLSITDNATGSPQTVSLTGGGEFVALSSGSSALSISSPGGAATGTIQIAAVDGFTGTVNLTCSVAYQGQGTVSDAPTCVLSPSQAQITGTTAVSSTLTVSTTAPIASAAPEDIFKGVGVSLAAMLCFVLLPRRRWRRSVLLIAIWVGVTVGFIGCSTSKGGSSSSPGNPGTTIGSYVVTVTATSGTAVASTTVSLSLQ